MAPFRLSRLSSKSKLKPEAQAEEAAPGGLERGTLNGAEGGTTLIVDSDNSPVRPPSPPPIPVEFAQSPMAMRTPMARTLSFARTKPSREEEAELYAATPDEVLSPSSAQLLRSALQAEADEGIASSLVCPITSELMTDPVFTMDGQVAQTLPLPLPYPYPCPYPYPYPYP